MSANCGPVNPLQKLNNYQQVDRSLHQDNQLQQHNRQSNSFRQHTFNPQLDREFQQQYNPAVQSSFQNQFQNAPVNHQLQHRQQSFQPNQATGGWANDFAALSLNAPQQHRAQQQHRVQQQQSSDWSAQFATHQLQQQHQQQASSSNQLHRSFNQLQPNYANHALSYQPAFPQQQNRTEHKEVHEKELKFFEDLDSEFKNIEQEVSQLPKEELPVPKQENEEFKKAAQTISDVMSNTSSETASKFAQSDFLKLMQMVSNGKVSLNEEETKLVDEQGNDVHEEKLANAETQNDKLPDPLEGLNADDLLSPSESAKKVASLHHEKYSWDDVYADYRHDDDAF